MGKLFKKWFMQPSNKEIIRFCGEDIIKELNSVHLPLSLVRIRAKSIEMIIHSAIIIGKLIFLKKFIHVYFMIFKEKQDVTCDAGALCSCILSRLYMVSPFVELILCHQLHVSKNEWFLKHWQFQ